jgi:hypothetical protein
VGVVWLSTRSTVVVLEDRLLLLYFAACRVLLAFIHFILLISIHLCGLHIIAAKMASHVPSLTLKRERSNSTNDLLFKNDQAPHIHFPAAKSAPNIYAEIAAPLQHHVMGETKQNFFSRLSGKIETHLFSVAHTFDKDGIYLYKRPVRSASPQHAALLAQAGTVFNHVIVYLKQAGQELVALEFGPSNGMDVTQSLLDEAPAATILKHSPEHPEPEHLPMLYLNVDHHALEVEHIQHALRFASKKAYQVMKNNCIAFADFICRCLTGNKVKNAPLVFDYLVGKVPEVDSPLLPLFLMMTQMSWFNVADGSRLMHEFLEKHGAHVIVPVEKGGGAALVEKREKKEGEKVEEKEDAGAAAAAVAAESTWSADTEAIDIFVSSAQKRERSSASSGGKKKSGPKLPPRKTKKPLS